MTPGAINTPSVHASDFYKRVLGSLTRARIEFMVGGAFAFVRYTGIDRATKDIDLFVRRTDWPKIVDALTADGFDTELTFPHWLGKAFGGRNREFFVDLIFSGGNGVAEVDDEWFAHAPRGEALGLPVRLMPVEEMVWSKAFVMERERFDGADVIHLIRTRQHELNWPRLVDRFSEHWRVLLAHLILFTYVYPDEPPPAALGELVERLTKSTSSEPELRRCRGTLLSRAQYLVDVDKWNYADARLVPLGTMTPEELAVWTDAIEPASSRE
jgi:Aminoglycoside-2''-adenylyltransferase